MTIHNVANEQDVEDSIPVVSVVIPAYNRAHCIGEAIDSVLAQDTPFEFEIIVYDDGSTDDTVDIVSRYPYPVRLIQAEYNEGVSTARNRGVLAARGEYVAFLDSDDLMLHGTLARQYDFMEQHPEVGSTTGVSIVENDERDYSWYWESKGFDIAKDTSIILRNPRPEAIRVFLSMASATIARRSLLIEAGLYDARFRTVEDQEFSIRLAGRTLFGINNYPVAMVRRRGEHLGGSTHYDGLEVWLHVLDTTPNLTDAERDSIKRALAWSLRVEVSRYLGEKDWAGLLGRRRQVLRTSRILGSRWISIGITKSVARKLRKIKFLYQVRDRFERYKSSDRIEG